MEQDGEHGQLDLLGLDLLAEVLGRPPDHQPGQEHGDDDIHQHVQEPGADAAEDDVEHHIAIGTIPASGLRLSCMLLTEPLEVAVVIAAQVAAGDRADADFLAFHVRPPGHRQPLRGGAGLGLGRDGDGDAGHQERQHHAVDHRRVAQVLEHPAEHDDRRHRQDDDRDDRRPGCSRATGSRTGGSSWGRRSRRRWCRAA